MKRTEIAKGSENVLLPYQIRWLADKAPVKIAEKSRRIGITWTEAADSALTASARDGMDTWYLGYNKDMALEFIETAAEWARKFNKAARAVEEIAIEDESRNILAYRIRFASGHKIVALSSRPSNLRGKKGRAVIDEAAFHDDLRGLLKAALAFTVWGGAVRVISTHNGADNPFNVLVNDIRAGRKPYSLHRITLDDAIEDGLYHRICQRLKREWSSADEGAWRQQVLSEYGDDADEELLCIPRESGGAFLSSVLIEHRMREGIPVIRWEMPSEFVSRPEDERSRCARDFCEDKLDPEIKRLDQNALSCFGEDFGRSGDLTVIWPMQIGESLVRRTPFTVELRNIPFRQQEQILFHIVDRLPRLIGGAMDARGNGQYLAESATQRYGNAVRAVMLTEGWYRENMPPYKAAFEDGEIELPKDAEILADHRALVMAKGIVHVGERRLRGADGKRRHGDSAIAAALAFYASRVSTEEYSYTPAGPGRNDIASATNWSALLDEEDSVQLLRGGRLRATAGAW